VKKLRQELFWFDATVQVDSHGSKRKMPPLTHGLTGTFQRAVQGDSQATIQLVEHFRSQLTKDLENKIYLRVETRFNLADVFQELLAVRSSRSVCVAAGEFLFVFAHSIILPPLRVSVGLDNLSMKGQET
jgi:hypothetical protein